MGTTRIFFSYARVDSDFVLTLAKDLRAREVNLWLDQIDIAPGERWDQSIQTALERCTTLLAILSPAAVNSQNVMDEVSFALEENKQVIPILHKSCEVPFRWRRLQHIDFTAGYEAGLARLLDALKGGAASASLEEHRPARRTYQGEQRSVPAAVGNKGGINIGSVAGNAVFSAGGDIVAGNKTTRTTIPIINAGFKQEDDKQQFLQQIEDLRATLRELQTKMQAMPEINEDLKDEITAEVLQQIGALKKMKEKAAGLPVAEQPPAEQRKHIETTLQGTGPVLDKVKEVCERTVGTAEKVAPSVSKALSIVHSARHRFGLR